ncbi:hypothetical protein JXB01_00285 [Candidatus Micrarchaeota archaeon]|nr:hypothetical protein [Candidatus Micrarchaeota archaeon]
MKRIRVYGLNKNDRNLFHSSEPINEGIIGRNIRRRDKEENNFGWTIKAGLFIAGLFTFGCSGGEANTPGLTPQPIDTNSIDQKTPIYSEIVHNADIEEPETDVWGEPDVYDSYDVKPEEIKPLDTHEVVPDGKTEIKDVYLDETSSDVYDVEPEEVSKDIYQEEITPEVKQEVKDISLDETGEKDVEEELDAFNPPDIPFVGDVENDETGETEVNDSVLEVNETSDGFVLDIPIIPTDASETSDGEVEDGTGETETSEEVNDGQNETDVSETLDTFLDVAETSEETIMTQCGIDQNIFEGTLTFGQEQELSDGSKISFDNYSNGTATLTYTANPSAYSDSPPSITFNVELSGKKVLVSDEKEIELCEILEGENISIYFAIHIQTLPPLECIFNPSVLLDSVMEIGEKVSVSGLLGTNYLMIDSITGSSGKWNVNGHFIGVGPWGEMPYDYFSVLEGDSIYFDENTGGAHYIFNCKVFADAGQVHMVIAQK